MDDPQRTLVESAARLGAPVDSGSAARMLAYLDRLLELNEQVNLTSVRDPVEAVERHLLDSLAFGLHVKEAVRPPRRVVDVGSGGGFPGVPIAIAWPTSLVHLVDSTRKKVDAVERLARDLSLGNVRFHWGRADELGRTVLAGIADTVVARAVGPLAELVRGARGMLESHGCLVAWKSELTTSERTEGNAAARRAGMESLPDIEYQLDRVRRLVRFRRRD